MSFCSGGAGWLQLGRDAHRDSVFTRAGYRVVRLSAAEVSGDLEAALARVRSAL